MDLSHVRYFLAVFDHGSISAAAAASDVAQPTISQALRTLERELGTRMFRRIGRGMVPTSAGFAFVGQARKIVRDMATAEGAVADSEGHLQGQLEIRSHPAVSTGVLPQLIAEFCARHPRVRVSLAPLYDEKKVAPLLRDADCEIAVSHLPVPDGYGPHAAAAELRGGPLATIELGTQEYWLALPPDDTKPPVGTMRWEEIAGNLVVVSHSAAHATEMFAAMSAEQKARRPAVVIQNREARLAFVVAGVAPTWIEQSLVDLALERGVRVRRMDPPLPAPFGLVFDPDNLSAVASAFVEFAAHRVWDAPSTAKKAAAASDS